MKASKHLAMLGFVPCIQLLASKIDNAASLATCHMHAAVGAWLCLNKILSLNRLVHRSSAFQPCIAEHAETKALQHHVPS